MTRLALLVIGVLVATAACGSDEDAGDRRPPEDGGPAVPIVVETAPPSTEGTGTAGPAVADSTVAAATDPVVGTDAAPASEPPSTVDEIPSTTSGDEPPPPAGPLPIPTVELVEVAQVARPTEVTSRPGDDRLFVVSQSGFVEAHRAGTSETVLDISDLTTAEGERGLLGLAYHPTEPFAYAHFTDLDGDTFVAEYAVDPATGTFDRSTQRAVFTASQPYSNHNGGELAFGPDGHLYLGLGDGGSADDPERSSLDLGSPLGKIHRFDPRPDGDSPLTVPSDNPFVDTEGAVPTIWSTGLRNPWKFSFDPLVGDLWIADVGQGSQEEVNRAAATPGLGAARGVNFGWSAWEGTARFNEDQPADGAVAPTLTYPHVDGNCSVSGGAVARGDVNGDLAGWYVFGDYCSGLIWGYDTTAAGGAVVEFARVPGLAGIAAGPDGALHAFSQNGPILRLTAA